MDPRPSLHFEPFAIRIEDQIFSDLRARIRNTRWPEPAPGEPWEQGTDLAYLKEILAYWAEEFDWLCPGTSAEPLPSLPGRAGWYPYPLRP